MGQGGLPVLFLLGALSVLRAEVPGTPPLVRPGLVPHVTFVIGNDYFGLADDNKDDWRTVQGSLGLRLGSQWLGAVDYNILTYRGAERWRVDPDGPDGRIDQLQFSFGHLRQLAPNDVAPTVLMVGGLGLRVFGRLLGDEIQNHLHEALDDQTLVLPYHDTTRIDATAWLSAAWSPSWPLASAWPWAERWGLWLPAQAQATTGGQYEASVGALAVIGRPQLQAWTGLRYELRRGRDLDPTIAAVAEREDGLYYVIGLGAGPLSLEMAHLLGTDYGYGRMSLISDPSTVSDQPPGRGVQVVVGTHFDHYAMVGQLIYHPRRGMCQTSLTSCGLIIEYTSGAIGGRLPEPARGEHDQISVGLHLERTLHPRLPWLVLYHSLRGGWREERLRDDDRSDGLDSNRRHSPVVAADLGLRVQLGGWHDGPLPTSLALAAGVAGWHPLERASVRYGSEPVELLRPRLALFMGLVGCIEF